MSRPQIQMDFSISKTLKWLIGVNLGVWLIFQIIMEGYLNIPFSTFFALIPGKVLFDFNIWQIFTYMVLHTSQPMHVLMNMFMLWALGRELEERWGSRRFLIFYILSGAGAGLIYTLGVFIYFLIKPGTLSLVIPVMGASGAVFGILLAYGILFGERVIYFFGIIPMKAKVMVMIMGFIELSSLLTSNVNGGDVAYLAHLGGLASGYIVLKSWNKIQQYQWNQKAKQRNRNLKLVVDNENKPKSGDGPKYWN